MNSSHIAILGSGNGGHAMAVDMCAKGFKVNLFEMEEFSLNIDKILNTKTIEARGEIKGSYTLNKVTTDIREAIAQVKYIFITTPAFAHNAYALLLQKHVHKDQVIIFYPGAFGSLLFKKHFTKDKLPIMAEVNNLPYDARITAPGVVEIFGRNPVNIGFLPSSASSYLLKEVSQFHKFDRVYQDVLEAGLSIVNPTFHSGLCLLSTTAIENCRKRPFFLYEHGITPASARLNCKLDAERKALGEALGYKLKPIEDFTGMEENYSWQQLYMQIHGNIALTPIYGPDSIESRYFIEDVTCGLVPWSYLAKAYEVDTPLIDCIINIYSVIHEKNWWEEGRNLEFFGINNLTKAALKHYLQQDNYKSPKSEVSM